MLLHARGQFCSLEVLLSVESDSLLSVMLFLFYHHLVPGHQDFVRHDACSELVKHGLVNIIGQVEAIPLVLLVPLVEGEGLLVCLGVRHRGLFVLLAALSILVKNVLIEGLRGAFRDIVCFEIHFNIAVLLFFLGFCLLLEPLGADSFLGRAASLAHRKWLWHCDVVLALATFGHHILLEHQLILKTLLQAPLDLFRILVLEALGLRPGCVDIGNGKSAENNLLTRSNLTTLGAVDDEIIPGNSHILVLLRHAKEQAVKSLTIFVRSLANIVGDMGTGEFIMANVVEELFKLNMVEVLFFAELALLEDSPYILNEIVTHIDDSLSFD